MKKITNLTRGVVFIMGLGVFSFCAILVPEVLREEAIAHPKVHHVDWPFIVGIWVLAAPIFIALFQTLKLLDSIDKNRAFSEKSVKSLKIIKICAFTFAALIILSAIAIVIAARAANPTEDVAPVGPIGSVLVLVSVVIATFTAVLQKLLKQAIEMKSENDLIV